MAKEGSSISGLMDSFATAISLALQYGVPLNTLVDKFIHSRFEPSGFTNNKEIPMAKSVMDYIFRWMALKFLAKDQRRNVGLIADMEPIVEEPAKPTSNGTASSNGVKKEEKSVVAVMAENSPSSLTEREHETFRSQSDAPPCPECGAITIRSGACYKCLQCGTSLGCS
jgi:ribonucleoside-diphosphate reductase alpha chain